MKIRMGDLRRLVAEALDQMKLGVAGRGFSPGEEEESPGEKLPRTATMTFAPGPDYRDWNKGMANRGNWDDADDDDLDSWLRALGQEYVSDDTENPFFQPIIPDEDPFGRKN